MTDDELAARVGQKPAPWPLRLPVIRHIRAAVLTWRIERHYDLWRSLGRPGGWTTDEIAWVEAIRRGDA